MCTLSVDGTRQSAAVIEGVATVERNRRGMALPTLVVIEAVLALGLVVWVVSGSVWGATALGVAAVVSAALPLSYIRASPKGPR